MYFITVVLQGLTGEVRDVREVHEHQVVVGTAGNELEALRHHSVGECLTVLHDLLLIGLELRLQCFAEADGLAGDDVLEWAALAAWEDILVKLEAFCGLCTGQDETATWSTEGLVGRRGRHVRVWNR